MTLKVRVKKNTELHCTDNNCLNHSRHSLFIQNHCSILNYHTCPEADSVKLAYVTKHIAQHLSEVIITF